MIILNSFVTPLSVRRETLQKSFLFLRHSSCSEVCAHFLQNVALFHVLCSVLSCYTLLLVFCSLLLCYTLLLVLCSVLLCYTLLLVLCSVLFADIYISISMEIFEHRKYKIRGENGNN